jgi:hypothetical protein
MISPLLVCSAIAPTVGEANAQLHDAEVSECLREMCYT